MIGAIIIAIVGWNIRKIWPGGVLFLLAFSAFSVAFAILTRSDETRLLGQTVDYSPSSLAIAYASTLLMQTIIFMIAFGLSRVFAKRAKRREESKQVESKQVDQAQ